MIKAHLIYLGFRYIFINDHLEEYRLEKNGHLIKVEKDYNTLTVYKDGKQLTIAQNGLYIVNFVDKLLEEL